MLSIITETVNVLAEVFIMRFYLSKIMTYKENLQHIKCIPHIVTAIAMIVSAIFIRNSGTQLAIATVSIFLWALIFYNSSLFRKLFSTLLFIIVMITSDAIFIAVLYMLNLGEPNELLTTSIGRILGMTGSKIFAFWFVVILARIYNRKAREMPAKYWVVMLLMPFFSAIVLYGVFSSSFNSDKSAVVYLLSVVCVLLFNFFTFNFFDTYSSQVRINLLEQKIKIDDENYKYIKDIYTEIRQIKHDLKNQIRISEELFYKGNHQLAIDHLKKYSDEIAKLADVCYTGISSLDSVINLKGKAASEKNISFQTKVSIHTPIKIDELILCRILSNALDNAIEACERINIDNKFILFSFIQNEDNILKISVLNSSHEMNEEKLITEKNNSKLHGFGLSIIQKSVKKLGGMMSLKYNNGIFALNILIKCE